MHTGLKYLSLALWFALLISWMVSSSAVRRGNRYRRAIGFTLLVAPLAALVVSSLRAISPHSCPWDLSAFGGTAEYFRFFDAVPLNPGPGRCAPSGHAASGFVWLTGYIALRGVDRKAARVALAFSSVAGNSHGTDTARARGTFSFARAADGVDLLRRRLGL